MSALAAGLLALALGAPAQGPLAGFDPVREHAEALFAERTRLLLDAWMRADEQDRARARSTLERLTRTGAPATAPAPLPAQTRAWRTLVGPSDEGGSLQAFVDALDLRAVPGLFAARGEEPGELITVHVARAWQEPPPGDVQVSLWWLPPAGVAGREELRARSEPASALAFEGAGFEMFVRPPASAPGTWRLLVELEHEGQRARGVPIPVECVPDPAALEVLARTRLEDDQDPARAVALGLLACARAGARLPAGLAPTRCESILRDRLRTRPEAQPRPVEVAFKESDGRERWIWAWLPVEPPRVVVLLLAPSHEPAQAVFAGEVGRSWRDTARELSALLLAAPLPRDEGSVVLARLAAIAAEAGQELPLVVVARGDALHLLQRALGAEAPPFEALIASSPREGAPALRLVESPTLVLAPGGPAEPAPAREGVHWVHGERLLLLDELLFPSAARAWLPAVLVQGAEAGSSGER